MPERNTPLILKALPFTGIHNVVKLEPVILGSKRNPQKTYACFHGYTVQKHRREFLGRAANGIVHQRAVILKPTVRNFFPVKEYAVKHAAPVKAGSLVKPVTRLMQ